MRLERLDLERVDWQEFDRFPDRNVFQTREWLAFTATTQHAEPVLAAVRQDGETLGLFTGLVIRRYGVRILGSPFRGGRPATSASTSARGVSRRRAIEALLPFAFEKLRCLHVEIRDRQLTIEDVDGMAFDYSGVRFSRSTCARRKTKSSWA
jgi:CelD/BcsL family acetyltransferase involved in cellulose biosynthesis